MKVLIDIPDIPKNDHQRWVLTHGDIVLDGLTNGEVAEKVFDKAFETWHGDDVFDNDGMASNEGYYPDIICDREWFYRKWGETDES